MRACAFVFGITLLLAVAAMAQPSREVHGSADAYAAPGIALAWGVLRGADEAATTVVIRIVADPLPYPWLAVVGVDPFTKAQRPVLAATQVGGPFDLRVPRSRFAETPRTEIRLYATAAAAQSGAPALTVFYLGVPDTTPEFADGAKLDAYLAERLERARNSPEGRAR
jgi:hypothetical protein